MLDALLIAAGRSRTVDVLLVAGYALVLPAFVRAVRSRRRRREPVSTHGASGGNAVTLPERPRETPPAPEPEPPAAVAEPEVVPEPEPAVARVEPEPEPEPV